MKLPRDVPGRQVITSLQRSFGYRPVHQEGSHVILQRDAPRRRRLAVLDHKALRIGTLNAILRSVARAQGMSKEDIARRLFG